VLPVLLAVTQQAPADPIPPVADLLVYGKPGDGRIRVETQGELGWHHPGIYWLPKDTPLAELLKRAGTPKVMAKDGEFSWGVSVKRGDKYLGELSLQQFNSGETKVTFVLNDGDIVILAKASL
jgi:hypothetical protein